MKKTGFTKAWTVERVGGEYQLDAVNEFVQSIHDKGGLIEGVQRELLSDKKLLIIVAYALP